MRILLIEDNADDAELIAFELADAGIAHELHRVELRNELQAALEHQDWALVVCDSRLPGYSGVEAFGWVRERLPAVPFLFCIGDSFVDDPDMVRALEAADGWVAKDRLTALVPAIREAVAGDRPARA